MHFSLMCYLKREKGTFDQVTFWSLLCACNKRCSRILLAIIWVARVSKPVALGQHKCFSSVRWDVWGVSNHDTKAMWLQHTYPSTCAGLSTLKPKVLFSSFNPSPSMQHLHNKITHRITQNDPCWKEPQGSLPSKKENEALKTAEAGTLSISTLPEDEQKEGTIYVMKLMLGDDDPPRNNKKLWII